MIVKKFEDILAWKKAQDLSVDIYTQFSILDDWDFRNQICQASVSISSKIAAGFDRGSSVEFKDFLYQASYACTEVKTLIYLAENLNYINPEQGTKLLKQAADISQTLASMNKSLKIVVRK